MKLCRGKEGMWCILTRWRRWHSFRGCVVTNLEMKTVLVALIAAFAVASVAADCVVNEGAKVDCGYVGITQSGCESSGCCWQESSASGTPWCFYQSGVNSNCFVYQPQLSTPFSSSEVSTMRSYFLKNINIDGKGGVVAAPDYDTPGGSYYYHWMRDAALSMRCLQDTNPGGFSDIEGIVKSYAQWVLRVQNEADPNNQDVRTEPKFMLPNGEVYGGAWCRPQNDGPGLRATALIIAAQSLIDAGQKDYVTQYLWTGDNSKYHGGAIKYDLDWVINGFNTNTCDLWEEIRDPDLFWNRVTMKKAMIVGAQFAQAMGDFASANTYTAAMQQINSTLYSSHYNGAFVQECGSRTRDSAVIVGFNDGYDDFDAMFAPSGVEVANTVASYNAMFCQEYQINKQDSSAGVPGVLYGRYQGDTYAGGNPWQLATAALASLFYRAAAHVLHHGAPSAQALGAWKSAINSPSELPTAPSALAQVLAAQGDGVLLRLRRHVQGKDWHLDEQIDRNTGFQISSEDLTWSYAEVLNAMHYRDLYQRALSRSK